MADKPIKGRGAASNREGRFESVQVEGVDDGWAAPELEEAFASGRPATTVTEERARTILSRNASPDIPFDVSLNAYRGCEHGCVYCYARPSHGYLNLSAGLDFETQLFAKTNAAEQLRSELGKSGYRVSPINLGANTDPYQPIERHYRLSRQVLEVLLETGHPCTIVTKNAGVERDLDLLVEMARRNLVFVAVSVTTLDNRLAAKLEPRASAPHRRLQAIARLSAAGVPTGVFAAPIIPAINDRDLEGILERGREAGARYANYTLVRLPYEVKDLFREWLQLHFPERATHVMNLIQDMRGGRDNDPRFGARMRGEGAIAQMLHARFELARRRLGFVHRDQIELDCSQFKPPRAPSPQGELF
jgi:DNA repair photolyase